MRYALFVSACGVILAIIALLYDFDR